MKNVKNLFNLNHRKSPEYFGSTDFASIQMVSKGFLIIAIVWFAHKKSEKESTSYFQSSQT